MKKISIFFFAFLFSFALFSIGGKIYLKNKTTNEYTEIRDNKIEVRPNKVISIMPLGHFNDEYIIKIRRAIKDFYGCESIVLPEVKPMNDILSSSKRYYDADKILDKYHNTNYLLILTNHNISYKSDKYPELEIFGLGVIGGKSCIVSTFQLEGGVSYNRFIDRLNKVVLHELGHNFGLRHCKNDSHCLMTNTKGTLEELDGEEFKFCDKCKTKLSMYN